MTEQDHACSLTDEQLADRRAEWRELTGRAFVRAEPLAGGRLLVYRGGEETARILAGLVEAERECCPFLGFTVERAADEVRLTLSFPSDAGSTVAELGLGTA